MATLSDWNAYVNLTHDLALLEADLREAVQDEPFAGYLLRKHFGANG